MNTALIVGASRGLGLGLCEELFARGWSVTGTARNPERATQLAELSRNSNDSNGRVRVERADMDESPDIEALGEKLAPGSLDLLFINGGIFGPRGKSPRSVSREEIGAVMTTNALRSIGAAQILSGKVRTGSGIIAFMSSRQGSIGGTRVLPEDQDLYRASKAALNALIRSFTLRFADPTVTILAISPGVVKTDFSNGAGEIDVATSVRAVVGLLERLQGTQQHGFYRYDGSQLPW